MHLMAVKIRRRMVGLDSALVIAEDHISPMSASGCLEVVQCVLTGRPDCWRSAPALFVPRASCSAHLCHGRDLRGGIKANEVYASWKAHRAPSYTVELAKFLGS